MAQNEANGVKLAKSSKFVKKKKQFVMVVFPYLRNFEKKGVVGWCDGAG